MTPLRRDAIVPPPPPAGPPWPAWVWLLGAAAGGLVGYVAGRRMGAQVRAAPSGKLGSLTDPPLLTPKLGAVNAGVPKADVVSLADFVPTADTVLTRSLPRYRTVDELLATCPTQAEMQQIRDDFNITFDARVFEDDARHGPNLACTPGGRESSVMLGMFNMFRVLRLVEFDAEMPLLGYRNLYDWARDQGFLIRIFSDSLAAERGQERRSHGYDMTIFLNDRVFASPHWRVGYDPQAGAGGFNCEVFIHEAWHALTGRGHDMMLLKGWESGDCEDSSLEYGGAWAAVYWYFRWLAEHSGGFLSAQERQSAAWAAERVIRERICAEGASK